MLNEILAMHLFEKTSTRKKLLGGGGRGLTLERRIKWTRVSAPGVGVNCGLRATSSITRRQARNPAPETTEIESRV